MSENKEINLKIHEVVNKFKQELTEIGKASENLSKEDAEIVVDELVLSHTGVCDSIEDLLVTLGLKHQLYISIGEYGSGRTLLLENDEWTGQEAGQWLSSSSTC